jgi:hypothetical protein
VREKQFSHTQTSSSTIHNLRVVANAIEFGRRRPNVFWSTHAEAAPLDPVTQNWIRKKADEEKVTVARVRALIRANKTMPTLPLGGYRVV